MNVSKVIKECEKQRLGQWIENEITKTRYNARYKETLPRYLQTKGFKSVTTVLLVTRTSD